jgi:hypothetical protein
MDEDVQAYLEAVPAPKRRRDATTLTELMARVTGEEPRLWGSIVGFGDYHYRYDTGREGDTAAVGFAARTGATTLYFLDGVGAHADLLEKLGPHSTGKGCLYIKDLEAVDLAVLETMVARSYAKLTAGTQGDQVRDSG